MRIALFLAKSGLGARRKTEILVKNGRVTVNERVVTDFSFDVSEKDIVCVDGIKVKPEGLVYYLLNKPAGYTSTLADKHAKHLITELVPQTPPVWPVGRLDRETEGLIILTNDGNLTYHATHPKFEKEKEYEVTITPPLSDKELAALKRGVKLEDGLFIPDSLVASGTAYRIVLHSGKKRVVRRLFQFFDKKVVRLKRIRLGHISINGLKTGEWRILRKSEIEELTNV